ncbi:MAG: hypothetical protein GY856_44960, partial [bacterium]|nr:hypothetical protein [bacterium]
GKVVHELGVREQAHRQELAERAQERQRREQTHRRVIAGLTEEGERAEREYRRQLAELERLGSGGRQQPLVDLPFAWLTPEEEVRGEIKTISVPSAASYFALILEVSDPQPYPAYRLEIRDDANTKVWSSELSKTGISEVSVALPRRLLAAGEYRLRLYGPGDGQLVEEYPLRMELE